MFDFSNVVQAVKNTILTMSCWDILDILIVAYLIYCLINFVRKTKSGNVVKGIVILFLFLWLSSIMQLTVVNYVLTKTFEIGILAIIVLFQPELRNFLSQFGNRKIFSMFSRQIKTEVVEAAITQVVLACAEMSMTKTGALIAFQRTIPLDEFTKSGTIVQAETTSELLKNIFYPKTPLHDGAVIIKDGRITAAACMLPMSTNNTLSRELGMRHRAGIGLSERSDAVVVIVSEESGTISVAIDGMLKRHLNAETFDKLLRNELVPKDTDVRPTRRFLDWIKVKK